MSTIRTHSHSRQVAWSIALALAAVAVAGATSAQNRTFRARGLSAAPDGRVTVIVELDQPTVAEAYSRQLHASALALGARASATAVAQAQLARINKAQDALARLLSAPAIGAGVLYRAQRAYNGIAVRVDPGKLDAIRALPGVKAVHALVPKHMSNTTSVPFIGAPDVWNPSGLAITGTGIKVGVIDSGIDYLHKDFGGSGTYRTDDTYVDPNWPKNAKVVGGTDFVGDDYDADGIYGSTTPKPDPDPQDCNGHGTHVAGTLAGYGETIDNQTFTGPYGPTTPFAALKIGPGVAPGAELYSLRVFGCQGGTDMVIPAIDWAMDPNGDGDFSDHLDVINMSLGAAYGSADDPDAVASDEAALIGVSVVGAAGNDGDGYFIADAPAVATRAISVASAGDPGALTYTVQVNSPASIAGQYQSTRAMFGPELTGTDITSDVVRTSPTDACNVLTNGAALTGKVALIDRGGTNPDGSACTFVGKVFRAQAAGATFVIIANNRDGNLLVNMADDGSGTVITIPSCFISQYDGNTIKGQIANPGVNATILKTSLADVISDFSSRGPRVGDLALKPDIAAPGFSVSSALAGSATETLTLSGTSMATPHVSGTMALLKQLHPTWTVEQLKALVMNTAVSPLFWEANKTPPLIGPPRVGAGRVDVAAAAASPAVVYDPDVPGLVSMSFGSLEVTGFGTWVANAEVVNSSTSELSYDLGYTEIVGVPGVTISFPGGSSVNVPAGGSATFSVQLSAEASLMKHTHDLSYIETTSGYPRSWMSEEAGYVTLTPMSGQPLRLPVYAAVRPVSAMATLERGLPLSSDGTFQVHLAGQGLSTGTSFPEDEVSLVSAFELQESNPDPSDPVRFLGVTSDYQAQVAQGKGIADTTIYFGLAASTPWSSPLVAPVDILIDTNRDGTNDYELTVDELTLDSDVYAAVLCKLPSGTCKAAALNGVTPDVRDTVLYNTDVVVLPVPASWLGLSSSSAKFNYSRSGASASSVHTFDPTHPGLYFGGMDYLGATATQPLYDDLDGQTIQVTYKQADYTADGALGMLLLHHHNGTGSRAQVLAEQYRPPRKHLHH
jgi:subtilisin family serine protease